GSYHRQRRLFSEALRVPDSGRQWGPRWGVERNLGRNERDLQPAPVDYRLEYPGSILSPGRTGPRTDSKESRHDCRQGNCLAGAQLKWRMGGTENGRGERPG